MGEYRAMKKSEFLAVAYVDRLGIMRAGVDGSRREIPNALAYHAPTLFTALRKLVDGIEDQDRANLPTLVADARDALALATGGDK